MKNRSIEGSIAVENGKWKMDGWRRGDHILDLDGGDRFQCV